MTTASYAREADRWVGEPGTGPAPLDLTPVEGSWTSATALAGGIAWVRTHAQGPALTVQAGGHGEPRPGDWGMVRADGVYANALRSTAGHALRATFSAGSITSQMQTYQGLGVLTLHAFHHFADDRRDFFTREFFVPANPAENGNGSAAGRAGALPHDLLSGHNDPGELLGTWHGLAADTTKSIARLHCALVDGVFTVTAQGVGATGPVEWGASQGQLYADAASPTSPPAFLATFDHGYMRVHVQARINRGVLVVCEYTEFTDGSGRSDYFIRECYRR